MTRRMKVNTEYAESSPDQLGTESGFGAALEGVVGMCAADTAGWEEGCSAVGREWEDDCSAGGREWEADWLSGVEGVEADCGGGIVGGME